MNDSANPNNVEVTVTPPSPMFDNCSNASRSVVADDVNEIGAVVCPPIVIVYDSVPRVIENDSGASEVPSTVNIPGLDIGAKTVQWPGSPDTVTFPAPIEIGRASCRE